MQRSFMNRRHIAAGPHTSAYPAADDGLPARRLLLSMAISGALALGLHAGAQAQSYPAEIELGDLDGSNGFVINGEATMISPAARSAALVISMGMVLAMLSLVLPIMMRAATSTRVAAMWFLDRQPAFSQRLICRRSMA